jgi:chromosome partitioning protein
MNNKVKIIASFNNKGGVAKSTYAGLLGLYLAKENKKVLLIDGDPQSNLTSRLYSFSHNDLTLGDLLLNTNTLTMDDGIIKGFLEDYSSLDIIPANRDMKFLEEVLLGMNNTQDRDFVIAKWMINNMDTVNRYDYIIWDVSPSLSVLGRNILNTCDNILFLSEYNNIDSIEAVAKFTDEFRESRASYGLNMLNYAVVINKYKKSNSADKLYQPFEDCLTNIQPNILNTRMIDSFCDKFYWKRIA